MSLPQYRGEKNPKFEFVSYFRLLISNTVIPKAQGRYSGFEDNPLR